MEDKYAQGDRVFAKMKGFSPWPGRVEERVPGKVEQYRIYFYGTYDVATVKIDMLFPYNEENKIKYGKNKKARFKEAMQEVEDNVQDADQLPPSAPAGDEDDDEGELQIDEGGPPVLKREINIALPQQKNETEIAPVPVAKAIPKRVSKAKRDSGSGRSTPTVAAAPTPEPPAPVPQVEVVSRSGRKIKPKRFADDELPTSTPNGRRDSDGNPPSKRKKTATPKVKAEGVAEEFKETPVRGKGKAKAKEVEKTKTPTDKGTRGSTGAGKKGLPPPPKLLQIPIPTKKSLGDKSRPPPLLSTKPDQEIETTREKRGRIDSTSHNQAKAESSDNEPSFSQVSANQVAEVKHLPVDSAKGDGMVVSFKLDNKGNLPWEMATARNIIKVKSDLEQTNLDSLDILSESTIKPEIKATNGDGHALDLQEKDLTIDEIAKLRIEGEVIEIIGEIGNTLGAEFMSDCDRVIDLLERLSGHEVNTLLLKKHPEVVYTMKRLCHYVGNSDVWNLDEIQIDDFSTKAKEIRDKSIEIYDGFKSLFCADQSKELFPHFDEEVEKFNNCVNGLSLKAVLSLGEDPTTMENPEEFLERHCREVEMRDEIVDETSEEEMEEDVDEEVEDEEEFGDENYLEGYDDMEEDEEESESYPNNESNIM